MKVLFIYGISLKPPMKRVVGDEFYSNDVCLWRGGTLAGNTLNKLILLFLCIYIYFMYTIPALLVPYVYCIVPSLVDIYIILFL